METITINRYELLDVLKACYIQAESATVSGFVLPVYSDKEGNLSVGGWISVSTWQPGAIRLPFNIAPWSVEENLHCDPIEENREVDVEYYADIAANHVLDDFQDRINYGETWGKYEFKIEY